MQDTTAQQYARATLEAHLADILDQINDLLDEYTATKATLKELTQ